MIKRDNKISTDGHWEIIDNSLEILYPIFDYPHEHYTFKHFEV